eukprot:SAG11_NODE_16162_length_555_cov_1.348684_1_plen_66_part_01
MGGRETNTDATSAASGTPWLEHRVRGGSSATELQTLEVDVSQLRCIERFFAGPYSNFIRYHRNFIL